MKKFFGLLVASIFFIFPATSHAQYGTQYGATSPSLSISINKLVLRPTSVVTKGGVPQEDFVDNLSPSDPRFKPQQEIVFKLKVKNTSDARLTNIIVEDFLPSSIELTEGPGTSFNAGDFDANQEKEYIIKARVKSQDQLPADRGIFCVINRAKASAEGIADEDTAQFCIEKQVINVTQVPTAGPEMGLLLLGAQAAIMGAGVAIKRLAK